MSAPFHCGSQALEWEADECHGCQHGRRPGETGNDYVWQRCLIRDAITSALFGPWDDSVNEAMGYDGGINPPAHCASRVVADDPDEGL